MSLTRAFHEFGFHGSENVKAHTRVVKQVSANGEVFDNRKLLKDRAGVLIGVKGSRKAAARRQMEGIVVVQYVRAHKRQLNYAGRPFVRPALQRALPVIVKRINKAIKDVQGQKT
jgi:hypothetical protein